MLQLHFIPFISQWREGVPEGPPARQHNCTSGSERDSSCQPRQRATMPRWLNLGGILYCIGDTRAVLAELLPCPLESNFPFSHCLHNRRIHTETRETFNYHLENIFKMSDRNRMMRRLMEIRWELSLWPSVALRPMQRPSATACYIIDSIPR
jgi:hypothetical protein